MESIIQFGWNTFGYSQNINSDLTIGRVVSIRGFKYHLVSDGGEVEAELSGKLLYENENELLPKVGDWVVFKAYETLGYIIDVLPRKNLLSRKDPGNKVRRQALAANIDYALIVQGLDQNFNVMRLERYLVQLAACQIKPIVVLNKADLITDQVAYEQEVQKLQRDCPVIFCSTITGFGLERLQADFLKPERTFILIGSSGAGKSSLLNALMHSVVQETMAVSESNNKGRHTTTTRDLFRLPNGSLVIDTPGMREFGITSEEGSDAGDLFPLIHQFASACRFSDCTHLHEEGCAVLAALAAGEMEHEVYDSYVKLMKEQRRFQISVEEKKREGKQAGKMSREAVRHRRKFKY